MINPSKPYYETSLFLKNNNVSENELLQTKDEVYQKILCSVPKDHIFYHKWTSFSNKYSKPTSIRMRDDKFLEKSIESKLNDTYVFFSCVRINGTKLYFVLTSNYFTNYCYSTKSSNSFIRYDLKDLFTWSQQNNQIIWKERNVKNKGVQPIFCFWVGTDKDKDYELLDNYLNILSIIKTTNYSILNTELSRKNRVPIPNNIVKIIDKTYKDLCVLIQNNSCYWKDESISVAKKVTKEHHHIIPEEWFFKNNRVDNQIINDPTNIVLLCDKCHDKIHSKDNVIKKQTLDNVLNSMKIIGTYDNFIDYLENKVYITLPILYKIYNLDYE